MPCSAPGVWSAMADCFAPVHAETDLLRRDLHPDESLIPTIVLDPAPAEWPDPLRKEDRGKPDVGALPLGAAPLRVGR